MRTPVTRVTAPLNRDGLRSCLGSHASAGRLNHWNYVKEPSQTSKISCGIRIIACKIRPPYGDQRREGRLLLLASRQAIPTPIAGRKSAMDAQACRSGGRRNDQGRNGQRGGQNVEPVDRFATQPWQVGALPARPAYSRLVRSASCLLGSALAPGSAGADSFSATPESLCRSDSAMRWESRWAASW